MFRIRLRLLALILFVAADRGLADEPPLGGDLSASVKIAELEQTVSRLQGQLDSLESRSNWRDEPEFISALPTGGSTFSHGVIYDKGWTFRLTSKSVGAMQFRRTWKSTWKSVGPPD